MKLYERDYFTLTDNERLEWEKVKLEEGNGLFKKNKYREYPKAARHYTSIFPNNFIDSIDLENIEYLTSVVNEFEEELEQANIGEQEILKFINKNEYYHIIASILSDRYNFGHHDAYIIPEFQLGNSYRVDYLIIGKNSGGFEFIFVELESNKGRITKNKGSFGEVIRKGIEQIRDWKIWLESNYQSLQETFEKYKNPRHHLSKEFLRYDSTRMHYIVVAGRRNDFNESTYSEKRRLEREANINLLHYDNLIDLSRTAIGKSTY